MTGITTDTGIEIDRDFAAAPADVFAAWTTPEAFARWFGGDQVQVPLDSLDYQAEQGRSWSATMVLPDGNTIAWTGEFVEVSPVSRLVLTMTDQPAAEGRATITVDLTATEAGTRMHFTQTTPGFTAEQREGVLAGWQGFMDVLQQVVEG
ncbi:MAG TPA: SRPBCC domain-containing protein [Microbacterium sp.]|uniref:SRPBCC family protein n=1 Tax=Microbacterium sp. TaxID=51671 RepID=UPI002B4796DB|nr:SRPBCC domain-containing protein [Microbacterium sp.]HKT55197.1 SRPBCC domain-containing protein [Microbacterium sp.]